ncbi:hypothetical protein Psch_03294 [Pelotomaculum schinkii]|uniref:Uncharacterized protein n=1 Tax=Pelotomaculum schinkii TaxID=78350 RepID=A0A4Y7R6E5_9FIRM|nr:hypothetical protein [Pelotomaculum schinkii]TEB04534.1 hypothetical protein Psch_03294 [Pelotomaculum schinkii]
MEELCRLESEPFEVILTPFREYLKKAWKTGYYCPMADLGDFKTSAQLIFGELVITPKDLHYDKSLKVLQAKIYVYDEQVWEVRITDGQEMKYEFTNGMEGYKLLTEEDIDNLLKL